MKTHVEQLALWLKEAAEAHHLAVKEGTATDEDWPEWYADFLSHKMRGY